MRDEQFLPDPKPGNARGVSWGLEHRLQFIDFRLRWEGRLNRTDLTEHFGLSTPQASLDIAKYAELAPGNLSYDRSSRTYVAAEEFRPLFPRSSARRYLAELLATKTGLLEVAASFIGSAPEVDAAPSPWRAVDEHTVEAIVKAIRQKLAVTVSYQSMSSSEPTTRRLSPHALGYDGFRWHVRAYCHKRERFSDFVLARILDMDRFELSRVDPRLDAQWHTVLTLVLAPHAELSAAKKRVLELDYGMQNGEVKLPCRQAFLYYTLRRLGLHTNEPVDPVAQQITLKNRDELQPYIDAVGAGA
ncbi:WYL domain-containing protein [Metallibacterium sp.]|jgi:predicted DNA-binding transcriptional regulator YafY|uniref:helix-turn-helix transcriptional regulator n=1 Tax=Metallibacterium sp. TaxID=2940281 RepID=UPI0026047EC8|nr:WYL domain-containing protein [Metallibacterium sp.]